MVDNGACAFTSPHFLATQAGMDVLQRGGSAVDAMIAAAAMIAVAYPHMNGLGGDSFWLVHQPGKKPWAIDACGCAAAAANPDWYAEQSLQQIPSRGPAAALTMAGTLSGWQLARDTWAAHNGNAANLPLQDLLAPAADKAIGGVVVTDSLASASAKVASDLQESVGYQQVFTRNGEPLQAGQMFSNPALGKLLQQLGTKGLSEFYRGAIGQNLAEALRSYGSPLRLEDFVAYQA